MDGVMRPEDSRPGGVSWPLKSVRELPAKVKFMETESRMRKSGAGWGGWGGV